MAKNTNTALREQVIYSVYVRNHMVAHIHATIRRRGRSAP